MRAVEVEIEEVEVGMNLFHVVGAVVYIPVDETASPFGWYAERYDEFPYIDTLYAVGEDGERSEMDHVPLDAWPALREAILAKVEAVSLRDD